jgi:hypothetical protein
MKVLENRTKESKRDMEILDALEDIKEINYRNEQFSIDAILNFHKEASHKTVRVRSHFFLLIIMSIVIPLFCKEERMTEEEEDEALVQKVFGKETLKIKRIKVIVYIYTFLRCNVFFARMMMKIMITFTFIKLLIKIIITT